MDVPLRENGVFVFGSFRLDAVRRTLLHDGKPVALTGRLFETLLYLVQHHDRLVERGELEGAVWRGRAVEDGNLQKAVSALRKVLQEADPDTTYIVTLQGRGLRFAAPVRFEWMAPADGGAPPAITQSAVGPGQTERPLWVIPAFMLLAAAIFALGGWLWRGPPHQPAPLAFAPPPHSLAVLAFENLSGDPAQVYFSDGLSEELINSLGRIKAVQVASRVSAFAFKGKSVSVHEIGRLLNVGAVLEGSVRREGTNVRVTARLIDTGSGFQLWSDEYDRDRGKLLTIQRDIAEAVASSLKINLVGDDVVKLTLGASANADAQDDFLRGMVLLRAGTQQSFFAALAEFNKSVAADPAYARGYTGIAAAQVNIAFFMADPTGVAQRKTFEQALAAVDRSIALAPTLASAHSIRSMILDRGFLDPAGAYAEAARALALEPGNPSVQANFASVAIDIGHSEEAVAAARHATDLDPMQGGTWGMLADMLYDSRRYDEALVALRHAEAAWGKLTATAAVLRGHIHLMQGRPALAVLDCQDGDPGIGNLCLAMAYNALGKHDEARAAAARAHEAVGSAPYYDAQLYAQAGQKDAALDAIEAAFRSRDTKLQNLCADPLLDPIRDTPRFKSIVRQMNFPP